MPASRFLRLFCAACGLLAACRPHETQVDGLFPRGGGSETTLVGRVVDEDGRGVAGAAIRMRDEGFSPIDPAGAELQEEGPAAAYSDAEGRYRLEGVQTGSRYLIECRRGEGRAAVVYAEAERKDSVTAPDAVLRPTGAVRGSVRIPDSLREGRGHMYVYIPGLWQRIVANADSADFLLGDIPAGTYTLRMQPPYPGQLTRIGILEVGGVRIAPGETTDVGGLTAPPRSSATGSASYARDSAVVASFLTVTGASPEVEWHSAVSGDRIVMFYDMSGTLDSISDRIRELDALETIYLMRHYRQTDTAYPWHGPAKALSPAVSELPRLRRLWLPRMPAAGYPAWTGNFPALVSLNLAQAGLEILPDWVLDRKRLAYLDLEGNGLESLPEALSKLRELRVLNLKGNALDGVPAFMMRMNSLQGANLRNNRICAAGPAEKAWIARQDSLWLRQQDPLEALPDTLAWEETQDCDGP